MISVVTICIFLCLQIWRWWLTLQLLSLMAPRKVIDFQFAQHFSCCKDRSDDFLLLLLLFFPYRVETKHYQNIIS